MAENTDAMEMKNVGSEQEADEQEGEDDTNVDDDNQRRDDLNESIPVPDGSNPDFKRVRSGGPGGSVPDAKRDAGDMRGNITLDKKKFLKGVFGVTINKGEGLNSTTLYENLIITPDKYGRASGAKYRGDKILILGEGKIEYSVGKKLQSTVEEFKELLEKAQEEHQKTSNAQVEEQLGAQGLGASEEHVDSVLGETDEAIGERISESHDEALNNPDITANERRELEDIFSFDDYRELSGAAHEGLPNLTGDREIDKKIIDGKLEGYKVNAKHWKELAEKEDEGSSRRLAFELAEQASKLKGDRLTPVF